MAKGDVCGLDECTVIVTRMNARYCTPRHKTTANRRAERVRAKERRAVQSAIREDGNAGRAVSKNIGLPTYQRYRDLGLHEKWAAREMDANEVADLLGVKLSTAYRLREYRKQEIEWDELRENWDPEPWAIKLLDDFAGWREAFFEVKAGQPYVTKDFHQRWINQLLATFENGTRSLILSPPRHGKTDLLIHFMVWLMIRDPDISIMWVSKNEKVAKRSIFAIAQILEHHELLRETYLPPGQYWKPDRKTGLKWAANEIYLANASVVGQKSPTLQAIGARGSIINQDVDFMICDDIEDSKSTLTEGSRAETRNWWVTDIGSRIMTHSAIAVIGSRQHADDLYSRLLTNPGWSKIIEEAHSSECQLEEHPLHAHKSCMLWPEVNSYEWWMTQRIEADATGGRKLFLMVYQNEVEQWATVIFQRAHLNACRNYDRSIGQWPKGCKLVAGLDPAVTGHQAAVLWAFDVQNQKQYLVDIDNEEGGGVSKFLSQMKAWKEKYGCTHWVLEENGWQEGYAKDRDVIAWRDRNSMRIEGHDTYRNKWDPRFGMKAFAELAEDQILDLPYQEINSQSVTDTFIHQAVLMEPGMTTRAGKGTRGVRSDVVMAGWFPQKEWRRLVRRYQADQKQDESRYQPLYRDYDPYQGAA